MSENNKAQDEVDKFFKSLGPIVHVPNTKAPTHEDYDTALYGFPENNPVPFEDDEDIDVGNLTPPQEIIYADWERKEANRRHEIFIAEMIAHSNRRIAYQRAYPGVSDSTATANAYRLLARPEVASRIREGLATAKADALAVVKTKYEGQIADIEEKRKILAAIMRGEANFEKDVAVKGGQTETLKRKPDFHERLRAIFLDNKMEEEWKSIISLPDSGIAIWGHD